MNYPNRIDPQKMAALLGCSVSDLPAVCVKRISEANLNYAALPPKERDAHILKVLKRIDEPDIKRSTDENIEAFEAGWRENYELCLKQGVTRANLKPKYVRPYECIRFEGDYIVPEDPYIYDSLLWIAFHYSFNKYFTEFYSIVEFGCGTGQYLYDLAQLFPKKKLIGADWTEASGMILGLMAKNGVNISGRRFDMLKPDTSFKLSQGTAVLTVGALEQIGANFGNFLEYLLAQNPAIVVHHEPIDDFYGTDTLPNYLGWLWHRRRNYLTGYVGALKKLEASGHIRILDAKHLAFGDPFHDSASRIVWQPISK